MSGFELDRVVAITGGGRGIGRAEALAFGRSGARVIVNNRSPEKAEDVARAIRDAGGEAVAHHGDVADAAVARGLLECALDHFGRLDVLVNNAGIVRDRMLVNMSDEEWDEAIRVNLRGTFTTMRHCARYWREQSKAGQISAAIINTSSAAGLYRNVGQTNYGAAKAGVAALTVIAADELGRYGVTVNAVAPAAATEMSAAVIPEQAGDSHFDFWDVENIPPLILWLASLEARHVTGRLFDIRGGRIAVVEGWRLGPRLDVGRRWEPEEIGRHVGAMVAAARPHSDIEGLAPGESF